MVEFLLIIGALSVGEQLARVIVWAVHNFPYVEEAFKRFKERNSPNV